MDTVMLLVPLLVLGVVAAFGFAGCTPFTSAPGTTTPEGPGTGTGTGTGTGGTGTGTGGTGTAPTPTHPANAYPDLIHTEDRKSLRSYWRLGEPAGATQAVDEEPTNPMPGNYKGVTGLGSPGALVAGDAANTAAKLDGATGFVEHDFDTLLNPPSAFTIEAWVHPEPVAAGTVGVVVGSYSARPAAGYVLQVLQVSATQVQAQVRLGAGNQFRTLSVDLTAATAHNGWHYLAATYGKDTPTGPNLLKLFVDAGAPSQLPAPGEQPLNFFPAQPGAITPPFRIGAGLDETGVQTTPAHFFKGGVDEVALYDQPLGAGLIKNHFDTALKP